MSRYAHYDTPKGIQRWLKQDRGQGTGSHYRPWLEVKDVPSLGRHRIFCAKTKRTTHLLSDLECHCEYGGEYIRGVIDIREQYPLLPLSETQEIANNLGFRHPHSPRSHHDVVMTTDQLWTIEHYGSTSLRAISVKYKADRLVPRIIQKHSIEAEYWRRRDIEFVSFDEESTTKDFVRNWRHIRRTLHPLYDTAPFSKLVREVDSRLKPIALGGVPLRDLVCAGAKAINAPSAEVLSAVYRLIATRHWDVDIHSHELSQSAPLRFVS